MFTIIDKNILETIDLYLFPLLISLGVRAGYPLYLFFFFEIKKKKRMPLLSLTQNSLMNQLILEVELA